MKMKKLAAIAMLLSATPLFAQAAPTPTTLSLSATSEVRAAPDMAEIGAGVITQATEAGAALSANSERMNRVVAALKKAGVESRDIQTTGLNVQPQFRYAENQPPQLVGFQATNRVQVVVRKLAATGPIIDALVKEGANQIDGPTFRMANPEPLTDKARAEAVKIAKTRADLYASAAGLKVKRIRSISEGAEMRPQPMPRMAMMAREDSSSKASVEAGELTIAATVTMEFELE